MLLRQLLIRELTIFILISEMKMAVPEFLHYGTRHYSRERVKNRHMNFAGGRVFKGGN